MKKSRLVLPMVLLALATLSFSHKAEAQDYGYYPPPAYQRPAFRPQFSLTISGGLHFVDVYSQDTRYQQDAYGLGHGMLEIGAHLWIHPNLSIDLGVGGHFTTPQIPGVASWGYISLKPGIRARLGVFYIRGAVDLIFGERDQRRPTIALFGFLVGAGIRIPVGRSLRLFAEIDYQFLFAETYYMPFYGQVGLEFMF